MSKAFWTIRQAIQTANGTWKPDLPSLASLSYINPCDINRMTAGTAPADHVHVLAGGVALMSDQAGGAHEHYIVYHSGAWVQQARSGVAHSHPVNATPDYFMTFVKCSDADYAILLAAPYNVKVICEAMIDAEGNPGALVTTVWTAAEKTYWTNAALSVLGIALPAVIDRGARLVSLLLGLFMSRRPTSDQGMR